MERVGSGALRKWLVYIALAAALAALAFLLIGDRTLLALGKSLRARGHTEASTAALETLFNLFPDSEYAAEGLLYMAKSSPPVRPDPYHPGVMLIEDLFGLPEMVYMIKQRVMSWTGAHASDEGTPQKMSYLERLLEQFPDSKWRVEAMAELGYALSRLGRYEEAAGWMQQAWDDPDYAASDPELGLYLAQTYLNLGDLDRAMETLVQAREKAEQADASHAVLFSLALAFENLGAYDHAYDIATKFQSVHFGMTDLRSRLERTMDQTTGNGEPPSLVGVATLNGKNLAGVRVILGAGDSSDERFRPAKFVAQAVTDANGRFELYRISPGTYQIGLALPAQMARESTVHFDPDPGAMSPTVEIQEGATAEIAIRFERSPLFTYVRVIDQEPYPVLELAWEEDPRAAAYRIGLIQKARPSPNTEVTGHAALADVTAWAFETPEARISLEELYLHSTNLPYVSDRPEAEIDLTAVLGFRHPDVSAHFYVRPIDADGEPLGNWRGEWDGLSEARRNLASVELPSRRTHADELLLQRDYDAAIAAYEEQLERNPNDLHSLYVLWALYTFGTDGSGSHQDLALGKQYGERLLELLENPTVRSWVERSLER